jgi:pimeloyl-ACP methyl ester carboxylesterase
VSTLAEARAHAGARTTQLSDGCTAYHVHGDSGPWVVLVHGLLTPSFAWEPIAERLAGEGFRVLRYDWFGRGLSDRPPLQYGLRVYLRQLRELTEFLGIGTAHLIGWSMGAVIVAEFAAEHPERVSSLALIAPALFVNPPLPLRILMRLPGAQRIVASRIGAVIDRLEALHLSRVEQFPNYRQRAREQLAFPGVPASFASTLIHIPLNAGEDLRSLGEHPRPVLVVWGDNDTVTPYAHADRVRKLFPRATHLTVEGGKHGPHLDHSELVLPAILDNLRASSA